MDLLSLIRTLVDIPSVTPREGDLGLLLFRLSGDLGMEARLQEVEPGRFNVLLNYSPGADVLFCTHLDTVSPHISSRIEGDFIYGRGACDAKGIMAAMIVACRTLREAGQDSPALLFVAGEETDSRGAKAAFELGLRARYVVVGEPTENKLARGQKGSLSYTLQTSGKSAHSAYPERGSSAIHLLLDILADIRRVDWGRDPLLGESTLNIGLISGGAGANVLADAASAWVFHRLTDRVEPRKEQLRGIVNGRAGIEFHAQNDPQELHTVEGFDTTVVNFGSDVPYLRAIATPLLIGPGSIHDAHTDDERIFFPEVCAAVDLYMKLFRILHSN